MLLTVTTTHQPATDIGYLLHKSPDKLHTKNLPFGQAHVFYPEASENRCMAALLLDVDPIALVRKSSGTGFALEQYVNDRPYAASSFMSVAINRMFGTLLSGTSKQRQSLVEQDMPLVATIHALPCRANEEFLKELFEPLGYQVEMERYTLDEKFPEWGNSPYFKLTLTQTCPLRDLLQHLYVLIPVLDNKKHYYIGKDEIEKLLDFGEGWLKDHPQKERIAQRYFRNLHSFSREALERLKQEEPLPDTDENFLDEILLADTKEEALEETIQADKKISLNKRRYQAVLDVLKERQVDTLLDLGCGEGRLLNLLKSEKSFRKIAGCDASMRVLEIAQERLKPDRQRQGEPKIELFQSALTYRDKRFSNYDAITLIEVIEHIDPPRLGALERVVFDSEMPRVVVVTTPNSEYNMLFLNLQPGKFRHADHRFEWTRAEFTSWANEIAARYGYTVTFAPIGDEDPALGAPTQMAVFVKQTVTEDKAA